MSDITDRLRNDASMNPDRDEYRNEVLGRAATEIESLRSELARVKEAAELLANGCISYDEECRYHCYGEKVTADVRRKCIAAAESIRANPTAAALVEQARKETQ